MAAGSEVARLFVTVGADVTGLQSGMTSASSMLTSAGTHMMHTGTALTAAITYPIIRIGTSIIDTAATFQEKMAVIAGLAIATGGDVGQLEDAILAVGRSVVAYGADANAVADAVAIFYQEGLSAGQIFGDLEGVIDGTAGATAALGAALLLVRTSSVSMEDAVALTVSMMATFGVAAEDMTEMFDFMTGAADASVTEVDEIQQAFKNAAPSLRIFGWEAKDIVKALAIMAQHGIRGSEAGTALKRMFMNMNRPTKAVTDTLKMLGISLYDVVTGQMKPAPEIFGELEKALYGTVTSMTTMGGATRAQITEMGEYQRKIESAETAIEEYHAGVRGLGMTDEARARAIEQLQNKITLYTGKIDEMVIAETSAVPVTRELTEQQRNLAMQTLFGFHGIKAGAAILRSGTEGWNEMTESIGAQATMQEKAELKMATFRGEMLRAKQALTDLAITVGLPFLKEFLTPLVIKAGEAAQWFANLSPQVQRNAIWFALAAAAIGPFLLILGAVVSAIGILISPIGLVVVGVVALVAAFVAASGGIGPAIDKLVSVGAVIGNLVSGPIGMLSGEGLDAMMRFADGLRALGVPPEIIEGILSFAQELVAKLWETADRVKAWAVGFWDGVKAGFAEGGFFGAISAAMGGVEGLGEALSPITDFLGEKLAEGMAAVWARVQESSPLLASALEGAFAAVQIGDFSGVISALAPLGEAIATKLVEFAQQAWTDFQAAFPDVATFISGIAEKIGGVFETVGSILAGTFGPALTEAWGHLQSAFAGLAPLWEKIVELAKALWVALKPVAEIIGVVLVVAFGVLMGFINGLILGLSGFIDGLVVTVTGVVEFITGVVEVVGGLLDVIIGLVTGNNERMLDGWDRMKEGAIKIWDGLKTTVIGIFQTFRDTVLGFVEGLVAGVILFFTNLYNELVGGSIIPDMIRDILDAFTTFISDLLTDIGQFVLDMVQKFTDMMVDSYEVIRIKIADIWDALSGFFSDTVTKITTWGEEVFSAISGAFGAVNTEIVRILGVLTTSIGGWFGGLIDSAITWGSDLLALLKKPFEALLQFVRNMKIPLPHFTVNWQDVMGVRVPSGVSVKWYGSGLDAIFDTPTLIGVGERGAERVTVTPLHKDRGGEGGDVSGGLDVNLNMTVNGRKMQTLHEKLQTGKTTSMSMQRLAVFA